MKHGSFISEHTAEYILVPDLLRRLTPHYQHIIPMFFWSTREGNTIAARTMSDVTVRLLTAFPRRPKITVTHPDRITMKVNQRLLAYSRAGAEMGVPVIAGIPLVSSFRDLRPDSPCAWYDLQPLSSEEGDCHIEMAADGSVVAETPIRPTPSEPLTDASILALLADSSSYPWEHAIETLRSLRHSEPEFSGFPFFGGYRPFHFVLPQP